MTGDDGAGDVGVLVGDVDRERVGLVVGVLVGDEVGVCDGDGDGELGCDELVRPGDDGGPDGRGVDDVGAGDVGELGWRGWLLPASFVCAGRTRK